MTKTIAMQICEELKISVQGKAHKQACEALREYIKQYANELPESLEEAKKLELELDIKERKLMSIDERREKAAFLLEGVK